MAVCIGIAGLDGQCQTEQHRFSILEFVGEGLQAQQGTDARIQFGHVDWLVKEIVGSGFDAADAMTLIRQAGDKNDGNQARLRARFDFVTDFEAIAAGHHDVEENQVRIERRTGVEGVISVAGRAHVIFLPPQQQLQAAAHVNIVIDDKDFPVHEIPLILIELNNGWVL